MNTCPVSIGKNAYIYNITYACNCPWAKIELYNFLFLLDCIFKALLSFYDFKNAIVLIDKNFISYLAVKISI